MGWRFRHKLGPRVGGGGALGWGLGFGVSGLGFRVLALGFRFKVPGTQGFWSFGLGVEGLRPGHAPVSIKLKFKGSGCRAKGAGFRAASLQEHLHQLAPVMPRGSRLFWGFLDG